jgi:hypothetical protein
MALTNNLKTQVDLPVWEWMRFAPVSSSGITCLTTARDGSSPYLYYFGSNVLYRYDTIGDTWQQLSTNTTPVTILNAKYVKNQGYRGQVLGATSTTLQLPSSGVSLNNYEIEIYAGTGKGQRRTITSTNAEVIHDVGVATAVTQNSITDTLKRYKFNEWEGYGLRVIFGTGFSQYRDIIYNTNDTLTVFDANYDAKNFLMASYNASSPYGTLTATQPNTANFAIVSQVVNLNSPWDITPDITSKFRILSGGIWWISSNASTPFFNFFYYDILSDRFVQKLTPTGVFAAAIATDFALAPINNLVGTYFTGSITSLTSQSITDSSLSLTPGDYIGTEIEIISGSGTGQGRRVLSNTSDTFTFGRNFDEMPTVGSKYAVTGEEAIYFAGNGRAQMVKYHPERSLWSTGTIIDNGIAFNLVLQKPDRMQSIGVTSATRVTNGIITINTTPTVGGTGYSVGELLTVNGGTAGRVRVESINPINGAVLTISLYSAGSGYTVASGVATTTLATAGGGSGCTIQVTSTTGTVGVITTLFSHDLLLGDTITFKGATEAAWNTTYTVTGIQSLTVVEVTTTATATAVPKYALATTLLVDETANWIPNEFTGKMLGVQSNGLTGAITWRRIIGNSQTTISFIAGVTPTNGNSRYFIQDVDAFGKDEQYLAVSQSSYGFVSSANPSSSIDSTKNWPIRAWNNNKIHFRSASGEYFENIITTSTTSSLNFGRVIAVGSGSNTIGNWDTNGSGSISGSGTSIFGTSGNGICWSGTRFVAVGSGTNTIAWSNDGITWNGLGITIHTVAGNGVAWNGIRFITVGSGSNTIAHSSDGNTVATFTGLGTSIFSTQGNAVAWNGTRWVAVGQGTNTIAHCIDTGSAVTFVGLGTGTFTQTGRGVCWAGTQFVAVGSGSNTFATSSDGVTWSGGGNTPFTIQGNAVAWNGNITVAVGSGSNTIAYSTNSGSTWTPVASQPFTVLGSSIAWNGTYWIAGGAGTNTSAFSTDGINWTGNGATIITTQVNGIASPTPYRSMTPNIGFTPDSTTRYQILDTSGIASAGSGTALTDINKNWKTNQWIGKRLLITGGTGAGQESTITANSATQLTVANTTAPDNTSTYTILGRPVTSTGMTLEWNWSGSIAADKGKLLISPRGGNSHTFDIYDLRTNRWRYGDFILGQGELLTTGTMYAIDGDRIYFQPNATGRIMYYDYVKNEMIPFATIPYGMGAVVLANRMEIIQTADGLKYLYIMRHSTNEMWRTLIYY